MLGAFQNVADALRALEFDATALETQATAEALARQTLDPIYADFSLPQQQLAGLQVGQVVNLAVDTFPDQTYTGKINAISPKVDATTRNVQVEATIANPKQNLLPGMFATVKSDIGSS